MDLQADKIELVKMLLETEDRDLIEAVRDLFKSRQEDFWPGLPVHVKKGIKKSKKQATCGLLTAHDEVIKKYSKYL
ncbi:hypothetical protein FW774_05275 (plasmid) [Pedobacter sp. BS3]|uniref:hypothetical protein n=1 Tax=Pedobacter sp. BS3 TaxID=2567937 RepID=UPI0011EE91AD|nr:hypothetical protein [Pedobacter sp. BS3]TZF86456.1 hypothetical protein FW774_05275 [Pedobacter sp. BS3]